MPRRANRVTLPTLLTVLLATSAAAGGADPPAFQAVACPPDSLATRCGYVAVPLDHAQPAGRQIELFVAVQDPGADAAQRQADPLFYLEGGPGGAGSAAAAPLGQAFSERAVVAIDQRGVGRSKPLLACPEIPALLKRTDLDTVTTAPLFTKTLIACGHRLRADGLPLEAFNTTQAAHDVDAVRRALGYSRINLYGGSYGTRLAQEVMRRHPNGLRAVVLDSVIPPSIDRVARSPLAIQQALERVFATCAQDERCNARYPNLPATYRAVLAQLKANPLKVSIAGAAPRLDDLGLQAMLLGSMYFVPGLQELPGLIAAARDGKAAVLEASFAAQFSAQVGDQITWLAFYTNECVGEVAATSPANLRAGLQASPEFGRALALVPGISSPDIFTVCQGLELTRPAPLENDPVASDVPALLLAGEYDPVTPAAWLPEAAQKFSRAQRFLIGGAAHGAGLSNPCSFGIVRQFLANPTEPIAAACPISAPIDFK